MCFEQYFVCGRKSGRPREVLRGIIVTERKRKWRGRETEIVNDKNKV